LRTISFGSKRGLKVAKNEEFTWEVIFPKRKRLRRRRDPPPSSLRIKKVPSPIEDFFFNFNSFELFVLQMVRTIPNMKKKETKKIQG